MNQETTDFYCDFVLNNKIDVEIVKETDRILSFYHTDPNWTVHIVVIPKNHITTLADVKDSSLIAELFQVIIGIIEDKKLQKTNYKVITNGGSFQSSQHLHFHLVSGDPKKDYNE